MTNYDVGAIHHPGWREAEQSPGAYRYDAVSGEWVRKSETAPQSGYTPCACRDCMDTTVSSDASKPELCEACTDAGCVPCRAERERMGAAYSATNECQRDDAYEG